jgi:hypothetical protein
MKILNMVGNWAAYIAMILFCIEFMAWLIIDTIESQNKIKRKSRKTNKDSQKKEKYIV